MTIRKITSMTMLVSFVVLILNSLVLYVVPEGRVAYWADWSFLGLSKSDWGQQHTTVGFLFLAAGLLHAFYNWSAMVAYMKNKARQVKVFTGSFNIALALTVVFVIGTYYQIPPMSTIITISDSFKDGAEEKYGNPPYGHAELSSLKMLAKKEGINLEDGIALLKEAGIEVQGEKDIVKNIAKRNNKSPQQIWEVFNKANKPAEKNEKSPTTKLNAATTNFPDHPQAGWGKKTIYDVCEMYNLDESKLLAALKLKGLNVTPEQQVKEIAEANSIDPMAFFETLQELAPTIAK